MRAVETSAPGKVILFGEHFVVKGSRALASSISLRARVRVEESEGSRVVIESPKLGKRAVMDRDLSGPVPGELESFRALLGSLRGRGYEVVPHRAVIGGDIPPGSGLGSSAATAVAYALAYTYFHGDPLNHESLIAVGYEAEKVTHGRPSGIDNTISAIGGSIVFRRGEKPIREDLGKLAGHRFIIADSGVPRPTKAVVEHVLGIAERAWHSLRHVYEAADSLIDMAVRAFKEGDAKMLGTLMNINQGLLSSIGASNTTMDMLVGLMRDKGALGAKLTGAGWGGCAIALAPENLVRAIIESVKGIASWASTVDLGVPGARVESFKA